MFKNLKKGIFASPHAPGATRAFSKSFFFKKMWKKLKN